MKEIPKGPTGKLQRIGLAEKLAEQLAGDMENSFVAPRTSIEEEVTAIWRRLLKTAPIGIRDNFHSVGGDSLSLAQMLVEVRARWGVDLTVSRFLACPTVEAVAQCVLEGKAVAGRNGSGASAGKHPAGLPVRGSDFRGPEKPIVSVHRAVRSRLQDDPGMAPPQTGCHHRNECVDWIIGSHRDCVSASGVTGQQRIDRDPSRDHRTSAGFHDASVDRATNRPSGSRTTCTSVRASSYCRT